MLKSWEALAGTGEVPGQSWHCEDLLWPAAHPRTPLAAIIHPVACLSGSASWEMHSYPEHVSVPYLPYLQGLVTLRWLQQGCQPACRGEADGPGAGVSSPQLALLRTSPSWTGPNPRACGQTFFLTVVGSHQGATRRPGPGWGVSCGQGALLNRPFSQADGHQLGGMEPARSWALPASQSQSPRLAPGFTTSPESHCSLVPSICTRLTSIPSLVLVFSHSYHLMGKFCCVEGKKTLAA